MGMGHIMRVETLARTFYAHDFEVNVIIPAFEEGLTHIRQTLGDKINVIAVDTSYAESSVLPQEFPRGDVAVFDCLRNPPHRLRQARTKTSCVVVFDDEGEGVYEADLSFNPLYLPQFSRVELATKRVKLFDEPKYMPLREEFFRFRDRWRRADDERKQKRLLLLQGGVDGWNGIIRILSMIDRVRKDIVVVPVTGAAYLHEEELKRTISELEIIVDWQKGVRRMSEVMVNCDAAISGCGLSIFELLCMGIPSLALTDESKEVHTAARLQQRGCLINLGLLKALDDKSLAVGLSQVLDNENKRDALTRSAREAVDGKGAEYVVEEVLSYMKENIHSYGVG